MSNELINLSPDAYKELLDKAAWLSCLEAAGVDNWEGYSFAHEIARQRGLVGDDGE